MNRPEKTRLGDIIVEQKLLLPEQLAAALKEQERTGQKLGRLLVESGLITESEISHALSRQLGIPYIDLARYPVKPDLVRLLPEIAARRYRAIVLDEEGGFLLVGMSDPTDLFAFDELTRQLGREIHLAVVAQTTLLTVIDKTYRQTDQISDLARALGEELGEVTFDFGTDGISDTAEQAPIVRLLQTVFEDALKMGASDIHIEPQQEALSIRLRIDGALHPQTVADLRIAPAVALRLKLMAGLDISEKRMPQDGRFAIKVNHAQIDVRISCIPTQYGESVVLRLLNQSGGILSLERLGMPPDTLGRFRRTISRPSGMVLVTGPTGSGKTTTLYAAVAELNKPHIKILTVEDPVEYRIAGINQVQVNEKIDLNFARVLRAFLRQDPDIILLGEIRDAETAQTGLRAAMTGHLVLSTLHTNDSVSTPLRLLDMGIPRYLLAASLRAVVAQRLLRAICPNCTEEHALTPAEHEWLTAELAHPAGHAYRHGRGCSHCNHTGYRGRVGVYELLEMTAPLVEAANHADPTRFLEAANSQLAGRTLRRRAVDVVLAGRTTVSEAMRIDNELEG
ncbi:MAG: GspE/PulE family protein [Betaproteobacteria bacterium]|nr:GspE/PulE family protein [Betaproteobacteria bacterium]